MKSVINCSKKQAMLVSTLLIVGILFYLLNRWTPLWLDDFVYIQVFGTEGKEHVSSFSDVLRSQYNHFFIHNGRFVPHCIVQTFVGIIGKGVFNWCNTIVFLVFLYLLLKNSAIKKEKYYEITSVALFSILFLWPGIRSSFIWMTGSCNYMWTGVLVLFYCYIFMQRHASFFTNPILLFICGFIVGWTHEGMISGLFLATLYQVYILPKERRKSIIPLVLGLSIGTALLFSSPGSWNRTGFSDHDMIYQVKAYVWSFIRLGNVRISWLLMLCVFFMHLTKRISIKDFIKENSFWFIAWIGATVFMFLTKFDSPYSRFGIELYAIVLFLKLINSVRIPSILPHILVLSSIGVLVYVLPMAKINHNNFLRAESSIINSQKNIVEYEEMPYSFIRDRYLFGFISYSNSPDKNGPQSFEQKWISNYYSKDVTLSLRDANK